MHWHTTTVHPWGCLAAKELVAFVLSTRRVDLLNKPSCLAGVLWIDEILHNHGKPAFVGIYRGIIIPRFLRWCELDSVHTQ